MNANKLFAIIIRRLWLIVVMAIIGGAGGFLGVNLVKPSYQADTLLYVMQNENDDLKGQDDFIFGKYLVEQFSDLISSRTVTSAILSNVQQYQLSEGDLNDMVEILFAENSNIITVRAVGADPNLAAAVANATAKQFTFKLSDITRTKNVAILELALPPENPLSTHRSVKTLMGMMLGIMISLAIIFLHNYFDTTIRSAEDIENEVNLQVIGIIPDHNIR